jgi:adenylate cyclase
VKDYTKNTEAYELFLKGRYFFNRGPFDYDKAIGYLEKAIKADPDFAPAYSKLAMMHFHNSILFSLSPMEMWPKIQTLTLKALAIDGMDADAHA